MKTLARAGRVQRVRAVSCTLTCYTRVVRVQTMQVDAGLSTRSTIRHASEDGRCSLLPTKQLRNSGPPPLTQMCARIVVIRVPRSNTIAHRSLCCTHRLPSANYYTNTMTQSCCRQTRAPRRLCKSEARKNVSIAMRDKSGSPKQLK
jgi:hypothetical protein